ncbi:unnamed protein product [Sphagnum jensenii]|uniref:Ribulose-phosphate 3-epimerase n=1 Tax=Sphagnum jensenii TaxID=128206 RepID=A0ABP1A809_9BRYO
MGGGNEEELQRMLPQPKIAPSMLASDFANLASEAKFMEQCGADWLHMDMVHSYFCRMFLVTNPLDYVGELVKAGASGFTFHVEVAQVLKRKPMTADAVWVEMAPTDNWRELVRRIKAGGMRAAVALKPGTPVEVVFPLVESAQPVDMVLVMTVEPRFAGQKFMPDMMTKVNTLRKKFPHLDIQVDGGLGPSTIQQAATAGANCIVAGSSVFGAQDPAGVISDLRNGVEGAQASLSFFK